MSRLILFAEYSDTLTWDGRGRQDRGEMKKTALLILDMLNDLSFPEGKDLLQQTLPILKPLKALRGRCRRLKIPVIYCNDNFGRWQSDQDALVQHSLSDKSLGRPLAQALQPGAKDYFVLKPRHSGFYCTSLEPLLSSLSIKRLIVTGIAGDICVLFTAHDAHVRGYDLHVPEDCLASNTLARSEWTLRHLREALNVDTAPSSQYRDSVAPLE